MEVIKYSGLLVIRFTVTYKRDSVACEVRFQDVLRQSLKTIDCHSSESKSAAGKLLCTLERVSASYVYVIRCLNLSLFKKDKRTKENN